MCPTRSQTLLEYMGSNSNPIPLIHSYVGIEPLKAWDDIIDKDTFINLFIYLFWFLFIPFYTIGYLSIHTSCHLHYTWFGCIRSCTKVPSHRFLVKWWVIHNWFMDLSNPFETIVYFLLIRAMTCVGCWDGFPMVSALVHVIHTGLDLWWIMT